MILSLCLAGVLTVPALALTTPTAEVENAAPIAEDLTLKTYKGVAISSRFAAVDPEGDLVTFQVVDSPARGQVAMDKNDPAAFTYTPYEGKKGRDTFTYVAIDAKGNMSKPATVKVAIQKQATTVSYSDLEGNPAHYAALRLAEAGVYTGRKVGELYCFDPDAAFTRNAVRKLIPRLFLYSIGERIPSLFSFPAMASWLMPCSFIRKISRTTPAA